MLVFVGLLFDGKAQEIGDAFKLDTIILINKYPLNNINPISNTLITANNDYYIIHSFTRFKTDSFSFTFIDKKTKTYKNFIPYSKELKQILFSSEAHAISANSNYIGIVYFKVFALFKIVKVNNFVNGIEFYKSFDIPESYSYIDIKEDGSVVGANIYERSRSESEKNSLIHTYKFSNNQLELTNSFYPFFEDIEFSHFSPNHWISTNDKYITISQTTSYDISIFDRSGKLKYQFKRDKPDWVHMDENAILRIRKNVPINHSAITIDSLQKYNDRKISRVEGVWFVNKDTLAVRYYLYDTASKMKVRYFDFYRIEDEKEILLKCCLVDGKFPINIKKIVTKDNFDILTWNYNNCIYNNELILIKDFAPINYLDRQWVEIKKEEEAYYKNNDPVISVLIFSINK